MRKILIFLFLLIINFFLAEGFGGEHEYILIFLLPIIFVSCIYLLHNGKPVVLEISLLLIPYWISFLMVCIVTNDFSRGIFYLIFIPIVFFCAYSFFKTKQKLLIPIFVVFQFLSIYFIFPNLFLFITRFIAIEKTIELFPKIHILDQASKQFILPQDKIIVLDYWSTSCGVCFKKFPEFDALCKKYKDNEKIQFYSINVPLRGDTSKQVMDILPKKGYSFKHLYSSSSKEVFDSLGISAVPVLHIIKNGKLVYNGVLETDDKIVIDNTTTMIEKFLK